MTFLESLLVLLGASILLLQIARRLGLPYPGMLAAAGVAVATVPGAPVIPIDPTTALALFIAPILVDSAFDYPAGAVRKLVGPLLVYAVVAVFVTAIIVAGIASLAIGLPLAAGMTLGAIVAPPDAAAATAVLQNLPVARRVDAVLKGESLFNDATALLLFSAGVTVVSRGGLDGGTAIQLALAAPGGILFGIVFGLLAHRLQRFVENTVGGTLLQFLSAFAAWIIAEHLHLSAVLATVASGMTIAAAVTVRDSPRMRVHSYAVWTTVVFLLNVLAFLLMGMQARRIIGAMAGQELIRAGWFAAAVAASVIVVRLVIAFGYRWFVVRREAARGARASLSPAETLLLGWTGMRGLVTLATAFALPASFPERNTVVLCAFTVVLVTLVLQGASLPPLIRFFGLDRGGETRAELDDAHAVLARAALHRLRDEPGDEAEELRSLYRDVVDGFGSHRGSHTLDRRHGLALAAIFAQREALEILRSDQRIGGDNYLKMQEVLDWKQLGVLSDEDRTIDES